MSTQSVYEELVSFTEQLHSQSRALVRVDASLASCSPYSFFRALAKTQTNQVLPGNV